jgi:hypothetical protein
VGEGRNEDPLLQAIRSRKEKVCIKCGLNRWKLRPVGSFNKKEEMGEGFGLFKKAIRPFGKASDATRERQREIHRRREEKKRKEKLSRKIERACEWEIGCIWGFGFVSVLSLFCILPF